MRLAKHPLLFALGFLLCLPATAMPFIRLWNGDCLYFGDQGIYLRNCAAMGDGLPARRSNAYLDRGSFSQEPAQPSPSPSPSPSLNGASDAPVQRGYSAPAPVSQGQLETSGAAEASLGNPLTLDQLRQHGVEGFETCITLSGSRRLCVPVLGNGPYVPFPPAVMVATKANASQCKGEIWISNGHGAKEGTNCPQGRPCCEKKIAANRGTTMSADQFQRHLSQSQATAH